MEFPNEKQIIETGTYKTFSQEIDYLSGFFKSFSFLNLHNGGATQFITEKEIYTLDTGLTESFAQTLYSIKLCCTIGSFSDANTLIRKLRDDLIQFVYIFSVITSRRPFVEESLAKLNMENAEKFAQSFLELEINNTLTADEQAVVAWLNNTVSDLSRPIKKKLEFENYMLVLKQNESIKHILETYNLNGYWEELRKKLNDYVHNNGKKFSRSNSVSALDKHLETQLQNINIRTSYISSFFLILILMTQSSMLASSDYTDYLDCEMEPPENSQYSIAPFIQEFIDREVVKLHPELKQFLKDKNSHSMNID